MGKFSRHTSFFTFSVICLIDTLFFLRFVPETKGKSLEEIVMPLARYGQNLIEGFSRVVYW